MLVRQPPGSYAGRAPSQRPGQHRAPTRREQPTRPPRLVPRSEIPFRSHRLPHVLGGTVGTLLVVSAVVAGFGGMFSPSPPPAAASPVYRTVPAKAALPKPPSHSGKGRRIIFDQSAQRVWLVTAGDEVDRSYLVTGSKWDNLRPGSYRVNGKTRHARTYRGGGTFEYFVKFARGQTSAIGFHAVTVRNNGTLVYTSDDLGKARTPGCVEAMPEDAAALWEFAPMGTPVVVTA